MRSRRTQLLFTIAAVVVMCLGACTSDRRTALIAPFYSYETPDEVRNKLLSSKMFGSWTVQSNTRHSGDPRPRFDILTMSGPYRDRGFDGRLRLTFFNNRLMSSEFRAQDGPGYLKSLQEQVRGIPLFPKKKSVLSRHTEFSYYIDPDGTYRVLWRDEKLLQESLNWVAQYS